MSNTHNQIAHMWANKRLAHRKDSMRGYAVYYEGDTIYSYGDHFPIARHVELDQHHFVLFTTRGYSTSTSKHKTITRRACTHLTTFDVDNVMSNDWGAHVLDLCGQSDEAMQKARRARYYRHLHLDDAARLREQARQLARIAGVAVPPDLVTAHPDYPELVISTDSAQHLASAVDAANRADHLGQRRRRHYRRELHGMVRDWCHGKTSTMPHTPFPWVRIKGDRLETSWGAKVAADDAIKLFKLARFCRVAGIVPEQSRLGNVHPYGPASVLKGGTIKVGCHTIPYWAAFYAAAIAGLLQPKADAAE